MKLAFDLRRIKGLGNFKAFTVRVLDMAGLRGLAAREVSGGVLIVDDPGPLQTPRAGAGGVGIHLYGGTNPPENGIVSLNNEGDVLVRHKFFSAVLGKPVQGVDASTPGPAYVVEFEPRQEEFRLMAGVGLRQALIDGMGGPRAATARFSSVSARAGRGTFYGVVVGGERYLAVQVTDSAELAQYDFFWDGADGLRPVAAVTSVTEKYSPSDLARSNRSYQLIRLADAGPAERLMVFRRGQRGAAVAGLWPLAEWFAKMEPLVEADAKALPDAGVDMSLVSREARTDAWMAACERFLTAYPSIEVKTASDEWRREVCARGAMQPRR